MEKVLKIGFKTDLFKTKKPRPSAAFCAPYGAWIGLQPN